VQRHFSHPLFYQKGGRDSANVGYDNDAVYCCPLHFWREDPWIWRGLVYDRPLHFLGEDLWIRHGLAMCGIIIPFHRQLRWI